MRKTRPNSITSIHKFGEEIELNNYSLFGATTSNCIENTGLAGCNNFWYEYATQAIDKPNRHSLKKALAEAEAQIKNYIGYPVGIEYIQKETHVLSNLTDKVRLNNDKVLATGNQTKTRIGGLLPVVRTFDDPDGWGFNTCVIYTIGDNLTDLGITDVNNLEVYQDGFELEYGNRLRPFEAELNNDNTLLTITLPVEVNLKYELYSTLPTLGKDVKSLDLCDVNNYPDSISVYKIEYELPTGVLRYSKQHCHCENNTCDACQLDEVLICLEPIHPEMGLFRVHAVENTEEDPELPPCWQHAEHYNHCCSHYHYDGYHHHYNYQDIHCLHNKQVEIEVNYLAGCNGKYGDTNFTDDICSELRRAVCALAISMMKKVCDCDCVQKIFEEYQNDLTILPIKLRVVNVKTSDFKFGGKWGAVVAKRALNHIKKRIHYLEVF